MLHSAHSDAAFFNVNRHLNPTSVCVASCTLCAFAEKYGGQRGWTGTVEQMVEVVESDSLYRALPPASSPASTAAAG